MAAPQRKTQEVRYKCCNHCEGPCPLNGHSTKCPDCRTSANGRRIWKPPAHLMVVR